MIQVAEAGGLDVDRHGERCSGKSRSATAAAARKAVRSAPKAKYCSTHVNVATETLSPLLNLTNNLSCFWLCAVCGLQFGRALQVQHRRQPWHRLHQELRSASVSSSSSITPHLSFLTDYSMCVLCRQQHVWHVRWVQGEVCGSHWEATVWHEQDPPGASGPHQLHWCCSG